MNNPSWFHFLEWMTLAAALVVAAGLVSWPRRRLAQAAHAARTLWPRWFWTTLRSLLFPLLALGLGSGFLHLLSALQLGGAEPIPAAHFSAWHLFWWMILAFNVVEAAAVSLLATDGQTRIPALLRGVLRVVVTALAAFLALRFELGWNIAPLLASTALITAVVGFALQGVLGNLLAGMSLNLTGALVRQDWVTIDDIEGQIEEMNWRETWLLTGEKIPIRIPNSKVADARIRNFSRPAGPRRCSLFVDASYQDPPDKVIDALLAAATAVPDICRHPAPTAFVLDYKSYGVGYELRVWLDNYPNRAPILGEVRRHVWYQFRRAGIEIPYPVTDQVLNDFMERAIVPATPPQPDPEAGRRAASLLQSDFARKVLRDADGRLLVPEADLAAWAGGLESQRYGRGEIVFHQGDPSDCCYVVVSGVLAGRIHHPESQKETSFEVGPGAVVGEMSLLTGLPRTAEIQVKQSAELLRIPAPAFAELLGKHKDLPERLSQLVAERVRQNQQQYEELLAARSEPVKQALSREGILRRFWRLLGGE